VGLIVIRKVALVIALSFLFSGGQSKDSASLECPSSEASQFTWLGPSDSYSYLSMANAVSRDGRVVVGYANSNNNVWAFRWTAEEGIHNLGPSEAELSAATAVSADGSVIVGYARNSHQEERALRWTIDEGAQDLGTLGGDFSYASAVSADGSVIVGHARKSDGRKTAFRWTADEGMQAIGLSPQEDENCFGRAVSADGRSVTGACISGNLQWRAFYWTVDGGTQTIGTLDGESTAVSDISADGRIVVGGTWDGEQSQAFRWTVAEGMVKINYLKDEAHGISSISADAHVMLIAGDLGEGIGSRGRYFLGTGSEAVYDINELYAHLLKEDEFIIFVRGLSPDGCYIVGQAMNRWRDEAFLLRR
jgi:probable HAF family extracellular repeat protein